MTAIVPPLRAPSRTGGHGLQFELHAGEGVSVLRLEGALRATPAETRWEILREVDRISGALLVDASLLLEVDDGGVSLLTEVEHRVRAHGGKVTVYAAAGPVARALDGSPILH